MKRAIYEWGAISTSFLAVVCFGYWVVSLLTPRADVAMFLPLGHWNAVQIKGSGGTMALSDRFDSLENIETVKKYRTLSPAPSKRTEWRLPGFSYQSVRWNTQVTWWLQCSLLIPGIVLTLAALFFALRYARVRRLAIAQFQNERKQLKEREKSTAAVA